MVLGVVLGIVVGVVSFLPLLAGLRRVKQMEAQSSAAGYVGPALLSVAASFVILLGAAIVCALVAHDVALPFAIAEIVTLVVGALGYGIARIVRKD